ncbi:uncharacterized protein TM35_000222390 [Trypanosoma theileri]|uniref:Uncharacterized protein n=1 Tax=Trypanosoma theileri TaxID=67003 RepID=A0A1X0NTK5_9TRYP|nr:uncharacterized protein TM35_000222390 [Trypanosoma theileri]ORC87440.1 hypothetical protein TM35_000222390 [Trypanosoma theileri]
MEELLEREIRDLREQQAQLEEELMALDVATRRAPCSGGGLIDVNTLQPTAPTIAATREAATVDAAFTLHSVETRLEQLEEMRRRQRRAANRALRNYFTAVSDYPSYQATRERRLQEARGFSFETRELQRSQRIRTRRMLEEQQQREQEEQGPQQRLSGEEPRQFRASPVPPSTYMNKYALMVEEWRQRRAAVEELALARAERMQEAAAYRQMTAESLRQTREVMGVRRSDKPKRAQSASGAETAENRRKVVELREIPLEVKMKLWPALEEHQQVRNARIKQRAVERLREMKEEESHRMALLQSAQQQEPQFGITLAALQQQLGPLPPPVVPVGGPIVAPSTQQGGAPQLTVVGGVNTTAPTTAPTTMPMPTPVTTTAPLTVPTTMPTTATTTVSMPMPIPTPVTTTMTIPVSVPVMTTPVTTGAAIGAVTSQPYVPTPSVAINKDKEGTSAVTVKKQVEGTTQPHSKSPSPTVAAKYNKNLTFKPKIRDGVPNFNALWAEERLTLAERKRKKQPTSVQPFNLTTSVKDTVVRGRSAVLSNRFISSSSTHQRCRSAGNKTQPIRSVSQHSEKEEKNKKIVPKGTRAHAMRTQAVFSKYITSSEAKAPGEPEREEVRALKEAYRRQKIVNARLKEYVKNSRCNTDAVIKEKVRALRRRTREMEREAAERLEEMRTRVAQIPPIFVEPTHLHDIAKARAETEKEIMQMLKDSGLDGTTLTAILGSGTGNNDAVIPETIDKVEAAEVVNAAVETKKEESLLQQGVEESVKKEVEKKSTDDSSTSESETDSSSESDSESDTSSSVSSRSSKKKTGGQYDDDFESSSTSS